MRLALTAFTARGAALAQALAEYEAAQRPPEDAGEAESAE